MVDAVRCAIEVQQGLTERNAGLPPERRIEFRVGIHLGDVVEESDGDLMGDGVNIAARLEGVAKPGGVCLSEDAYRQVRGRLDVAASDLGPTRLKNIAEPVRIYALDVGKRAEAQSAKPAASALTREIGLLNRRLPGTDLSLPEARVLYELPHAPEGGQTAAEIGRILRMDKAHLSRILARFRARGLAQRRVSSKHRKQMILTLTEAGRKTFAAADAAARAQVDALLLPVDQRGRGRFAEAMRNIRAALEDREAEDAGVRLRPLKPGDVGWIIHRQAVLYNQEYGWDWTYEGLASRISSFEIASRRILGDFVAEFGPFARGRLGRRAPRSDRRLGFPHEERRSCSRQAEAPLCRAERARARDRTHAGRYLRRAGKGAWLP